MTNPVFWDRTGISPELGGMELNNYTMGVLSDDQAIAVETSSF